MDTLKNIFKNKKFIIFALIFVILAFFLQGFLKYSFVWVDDIQNKFYVTRNYISHPLNCIFAIFLPKLFNLHPSVWKGVYFSYIETFVILSLVAAIALLLVRKLNSIFIVMFAFLFFAVLFFCQNQPNVLYVYDGFFRMLLSPLFFCVFVLLFLQENKNITYLSIVSAIVCLSNEVYCICIPVAMLLCFLFFSQDEDRKTFKILLLVSLSCLLLAFFSGMFIRKDESIMFTFSHYVNLVREIPVFIKCYVQDVFIKHIWAYILLFVQFLIAFKFNKKLTKFILFFLVGILTFFALLFFIGKIDEGESIRYWTSHPDLHVMYGINLCLFNLIFLFENLKYIKINNYVVILLFIISTIVMGRCNFIFYREHQKVLIFDCREVIYKAEKIIRLANLKNQPIYLDSAIFENLWYWQLFPSFDYMKTDVLYSGNYYTEYLNLVSNEEKITMPIIYTNTEKVEEAFKNNGGVFTTEELANIDFARLKYDKFILNE